MHNTHTWLAFLVQRSQPCLGWEVGERGESSLEYVLPDFQEAKAVSICLGPGDGTVLSIKMPLTI